MSSPTPTKVIIVGCGIAGPLLSIFLKSKGYHPVIYERIKRDTDGGLSLMLQANGLRVLSLIPGLISKLPGKAVDQVAVYSTVPGDERLLGEGIPTHAEAQPTDSEYESGKRPGIGIGIRRHEFLHLLSEAALNAGVEIHWERMVVDVQQSPESDSVKVILGDGTTDTASFVIGCDGLHSSTRVSLFGKEEATFTGVSQMGGFGPTPKSTASTLIDFFGDGTHMITYPVSETKSSWAIARRDVETKETWRAVDSTRLEQLKDDPVALWPFGSGELLKGAEKIIKYGLYDRPELKTWYKGRVVLLGDAAHPTTPHLGQGANQSFEDIYHLVRALTKHNPSGASPSTQVLIEAFSEYESIRLPRTAALVKDSRHMGEIRVTHGKEETLKRNEMLKEIWGDSHKGLNDLVQRTSGPFQGQSEI